MARSWHKLLHAHGLLSFVLWNTFSLVSHSPNYLLFFCRVDFTLAHFIPERIELGKLMFLGKGLLAYFTYQFNSFCLHFSPWICIDPNDFINLDIRVYLTTKFLRKKEKKNSIFTENSGYPHNLAIYFSQEKLPAKILNNLRRRGKKRKKKPHKSSIQNLFRQIWFEFSSASMILTPSQK